MLFCSPEALLPPVAAFASLTLQLLLQLRHSASLASTSPPLNVSFRAKTSAIRHMNPDTHAFDHDTLERILPSDVSGMFGESSVFVFATAEFVEDEQVGSLLGASVARAFPSVSRSSSSSLCSVSEGRTGKQASSSDITRATPSLMMSEPRTSGPARLLSCASFSLASSRRFCASATTASLKL